MKKPNTIREIIKQYLSPIPVTMIILYTMAVLHSIAVLVDPTGIFCQTNNILLAQMCKIPFHLSVLGTSAGFLLNILWLIKLLLGTIYKKTDRRAGVITMITAFLLGMAILILTLIRLLSYAVAYSHY